jgi:hypothetical protein
MDFERINVDADKTPDTSANPDDDKQLVDPLEFREVKTEVKVSYSFFSSIFSVLDFSNHQNRLR